MTDNPSAFPIQGLTNLPNDNVVWPEPGMALSDYFAAHCPITLTEFLTVRHQTPEPTVEEVVQAYAEFRHGYAVAMLKARKP